MWKAHCRLGKTTDGQLTEQKICNDRWGPGPEISSLLPDPVYDCWYAPRPVWPKWYEVDNINRENT